MRSPTCRTSRGWLTGVQPIFADVEQAVGAADVDEGAEWTQAAHLALDDCAYGKLLEQLRFAAGPVFTFGQPVG